MTAWGQDDDPTERQPRPQIVYQTQPPERRTDWIMVALIVLLTFVLGAIVMMATVYSLYSTVERLLSVPMCQEVRR